MPARNDDRRRVTLARSSVLSPLVSLEDGHGGRWTLASAIHVRRDRPEGPRRVAAHQDQERRGQRVRRSHRQHDDPLPRHLGEAPRRQIPDLEPPRRLGPATLRRRSRRRLERRRTSRGRPTRPSDIARLAPRVGEHVEQEIRRSEERRPSEADGREPGLGVAKGPAEDDSAGAQELELVQEGADLLARLVHGQQDGAAEVPRQRAQAPGDRERLERVERRCRLVEHHDAASARDELAADGDAPPLTSRDATHDEVPAPPADHGLRDFDEAQLSQRPLRDRSRVALAVPRQSSGEDQSLSYLSEVDESRSRFASMR